VSLCPNLRCVVAVALAACLAACSTPRQEAAAPGAASPPPATAPGTSGVPARPSTKYYLDDGPGANPPANLDAIPDAVPRAEPLHRFANRPYVVLGREYVPATSLRPYRERGVASWYGRKFHGQKTSTGDVYDMYAMTAAHPTLPLPSYARVTNPANGRSVVVRVNDRGPFLHDRVIDLSYAAAHRLGIAQNGSGEVEVEAIVPADVRVAAAPLPPVATAAAPAPATPIVAASDVASPVAGAGFVVQLGAFSNYANAQAFLAHVQNQMRTAQVEAKVRQAASLYRVYVGPFADRDEARRTADRIQSAFGLPGTIVAH